MSRVLHTSTSFSGKYLFTGGWGKLGTCLQPLLPNVSPHQKEMDILQPKEIESYILQVNPTAIIHMAAITNKEYAEKHKAETYRVNVIGTRNVAQMAENHNKKMFYISTDYIFDGIEGNYTETTVPNPVNWYGMTKYAGELEIMNITKNFCIIRTSFRPSRWDFPTAYSNVYTSADYVDIIAKEIASAIRWDISGIIHIGTAKKTLFDLARQRNPDVSPEENNDPHCQKNRFFNIKTWQKICRKHTP